MLCPVCAISMQETRRSGFPIQMCPSCHGAWLGAGALESISGQHSASHAENERSGDYRRKYDSDDDLGRGRERRGREYDSDDHYGQHGRPRKGGLLRHIMDLFD